MKSSPEKEVILYVDATFSYMGMESQKVDANDAFDIHATFS